MRLFGVTMTYNEEKLIPYVMPYLERMGYEKLIVYDNESTDNTVSLLKRYPFVEIRTMYTGGKFTDSMHVFIKNTIWKEFKHIKNAWMTISDFDEVLYLSGGGDIKEYLELKSSEGYNLLNQMMVETCFERFPNKSMLVHENENCVGNFWEQGCKMTLFRIDVMSDITYAPGAHSVKIVYFKNKELKSLNNLDICSFHLKYLDIDYCANKNRNAAKRLSEENEQHGWGIHYHDSDEKFRDEYRKRIKEGFLINDYVSGKVKIIDNEKKANS